MIIITLAISFAFLLQTAFTADTSFVHLLSDTETLSKGECHMIRTRIQHALQIILRDYRYGVRTKANKRKHIENGNIEENLNYEEYLNKDLTYFPFDFNQTLDQNLTLLVLMALMNADGLSLIAAKSNSRYYKNSIRSKAEVLKYYLSKEGIYTPKINKVNDQTSNLIKKAKNILYDNYPRWKQAYETNYKKSLKSFKASETEVDGLNYQMFNNTLNYKCAIILEDQCLIKSKIYSFYNVDEELKISKFYWATSIDRRDFRSSIASYLWGFLTGYTSRRSKKICKLIAHSNISLRRRYVNHLTIKTKVLDRINLKHYELNKLQRRASMSISKYEQDFHATWGRIERAIEKNVEYYSSENYDNSRFMKTVKNDFLVPFIRKGEQLGTAHYIIDPPVKSAQHGFTFPRNIKPFYTAKTSALINKTIEVNDKYAMDVRKFVSEADMVINIVPDKEAMTDHLNFMNNRLLIENAKSELIIKEKPLRVTNYNVIVKRAYNIPAIKEIYEYKGPIDNYMFRYLDVFTVMMSKKLFINDRGDILIDDRKNVLIDETIKNEPKMMKDTEMIIITNEESKPKIEIDNKRIDTKMITKTKKVNIGTEMTTKTGTKKINAKKVEKVKKVVKKSVNKVKVSAFITKNRLMMHDTIRKVINSNNKVFMEIGLKKTPMRKTSLSPLRLAIYTIIAIFAFFSYFEPMIGVSMIIFLSIFYIVYFYIVPK